MEVSSTGIKTIDSSSQLITESAFGEPAEQVADNLTNMLGAAIKTEENHACGLTFITWSNGLEIANRDGKFINWSVWRPEENSVDIATPDGRGHGTTLVELRQISETTSVPVGDWNEFETDDGYRGILNANNERGTVVVMRSGEEIYDGYQLIGDCSRISFEE
ncbi:hypothetical protein [cf. Phormidesmis sp. LEGE 11477]|uniref:hypothetical protein n=1 Tax=cf. Phormidesmis sp. LEGE 11477 TaxID=1828680 RepID=UPI0018806028|nr:hypothetical protein [cf. Phormidesmis sp. LEGE 11477]MBE9059530.1 hypothetical protein [cf. Phormidesmis sp. LEGE 11477]